MSLRHSARGNQSGVPPTEGRAASILVCDFCPPTGLCASLAGMLKAEPKLSSCAIDMACGSPLELDGLSRRVRHERPDLVVVLLPPSEATEWVALFQAVRAEAGDCAIIAVTDGIEAAGLCELLRLGASDFVATPFRACDVVPRVLSLIQHRTRADPLVQAMKEKLGLQQIVGQSQALLEEINKIPRIARCDATVLICGETGTGKEVCARAVHYLSPRQGHPFIAANCGAIPADLLENELFGHEAGAFTSANTARPGLVAEAEGGTLFLDEVDALPPVAQVKLLRLLQEREYRPLGARTVHRANLRVIAAANTVFEEAIQAGRFRRDLYYRLNVLPFNLPPLRERKEDILLLARHFLAKYATEFQRPARDFGAGAAQRLLSYQWPGNVRELENIVERAVLLSENATLQARDLSLPDLGDRPRAESFQALKAHAVEQFERAYLQSTLQAHRGNITQAAKAAQKNRRAFWELLRKHRLTVNEHRPSA